MNQVEKFIEKSSLKHNNKYDYSKVIECDGKTPVEIICPVHGSFLQRKDVHSRGGGCKLCNFEAIPAKRTVEEFIVKASELHNHKYDYSLVTSSKSKDRIDVVCSTHGVFTQTVAHHLVSQGCPECTWDKWRLTREDFITKSVEAHNGKYDYSKVELTKGFKEKVIIVCPEHGEFKQEAGAHMLGKGCRLCSDKKNGLAYRLSTDEFIKRSEEKHENKYDYSLSEYITCEDKVKIICPEHGEFLQRPMCHMGGKGCAKCRNDNTTYNFIQKYRDNPELGSKIGKIYVLEVFNETERFLKLGITSDKSGRFKKYRADFKKVGYSFNILYEVETTNYKSAMVENDILKLMRIENNMYTPTENFSGKGECLSAECFDKLLDIISAKLGEYNGG
ncbi:hypothetical protein D3C86_1116430 [compost metagenome]